MRHNPVEQHLPGYEPRDPTAFSLAVISSASDAVLALDRDGRVVLWNDGCQALFGWTAQEMLGSTADRLLPPERGDELNRLLRALAATPEAVSLETERLHKSGAALPVSWRVSPVVDEVTGAVLGASAVIRDISQELELRRQLEQARHLAEARFAQTVVAQASLTPHDGLVVDVNPALCRLTGRSAQQLLGRSITDLLSEDEVEAASAELTAIATGERRESRQLRLIRTADGRVVETRWSAFPLLDEAGDVLRIDVVVEDVSAAAAAEREVSLREARWRSLMANAADVALFCDPDGTPCFVTDSITAVFGYRPEELLGTEGGSFVHPDDLAAARATWAATVAAPAGTCATFELRLLHADRTWRWFEETVTNRLDDPAVAAMVVNLVDVSDRKSAEAVLEELAGMDTLTGLPTRAPLMAALDAAFAAGRSATTALAVVDVTRLKVVNDTYGQHAGDEVLVAVGSRLVSAVGGHGVVARVGGDRFAAMICDVADIGAVFEVAATLLDAVEQPLRVGNDTLMLTATIGAVLGPAVDSGALVAAGESALLSAKQGLTGPMHVVRAESASAAVSRARLIEDLRRAVARDELVVHFQPLISLSDGRALGAEALVRWRHPEKGLLGPGAFIDAAEDSGLIIPLGQFVLSEACRAAARWTDVTGRPFQVAVNLSAKQLTRGGLIQVVRAALTESGASPSSLTLEVTESAVMSDVDAAVRTLQELRDMGVSIAIDDFGTGYSSLTYLKRFPVTAVKIDRSFVSGLGRNDDDAAIVTSVINLARAMQLDCIAEGVETEQQRLVLQALGCSYGQGFLWSPALDPATFETWLGGAAPEQDDGRCLSRARELSDTGASLSTVAAALNADQQLTARGQRWTPRAVAQLLATPALR